MPSTLKSDDGNGLHGLLTERAWLNKTQIVPPDKSSAGRWKDHMAGGMKRHSNELLRE